MMSATTKKELRQFLKMELAVFVSLTLGLLFAYVINVLFVFSDLLIFYTRQPDSFFTNKVVFLSQLLVMCMFAFCFVTYKMLVGLMEASSALWAWAFPRERQQ